MTITVRELTINASLLKEPKNCPDEKKGGRAMSAQDREEMVSECVDQVLNIIKKLQER